MIFSSYCVQKSCKYFPYRKKDFVEWHWGAMEKKAGKIPKWMVARYQSLPPFSSPLHRNKGREKNTKSRKKKPAKDVSFNLRRILPSALNPSFRIIPVNQSPS